MERRTASAMSAWPNVSVRTKLSLVLAIIVFLMILIGVFSLIQLQAVNRVAAEMRDGWLPRIEILGELKRAVGQHFHLATRQLQTTNFRHLAEIAKGTKATQETISLASESYRSIIGAPEEQKLIDEFRDCWNRYLVTDREVFSRLEVGDVKNAVVSFNTTSRDAFDDATSKLDELTAYARQKSSEATTHAREIYRQALMLIVAIMAIGGVCALAAVAWSRQYVTAPILSVAGAMRQLAGGELDLAVNHDGNRRDEIGTLIESVTAYRDSLKRGRELAAVAELERHRLQSAVGNMPIGLCMFDGAQNLVICNARYAEMFGLPPELCRPGTPVQEILAAMQNTEGYLEDGMLQAFGELTSDAQGNQALHRLIELDCGRTISVNYQSMPDNGWVAIHEDVTERRRAEAQIAHMAHHDALTGLPNRILFHEKLVEALRRVPRGDQIAVLCLDLDRFKNVNDTLGHPVGDHLLVQVAARLKDCVRSVDTVARLGGDEFAIVQVRSQQPEGAALLAERLLQAIGQPYDIDGHLVVIDTSIGISLAPHHGLTADPLLTSADLALYEAKNDGRGMHRVFEDDMAARMSAKRANELDLRQAFEQGDFVLFYQPLIHLESGEVRGMEALLRWRRADGTVTQPGEFVSIAEEIGLIVPLGNWILEQACAEAAAWPAQTRVAVNVSAVQLHHRDFIPTVKAILTKTALDPCRLELEITESALLRDSSIVLQRLQQLRDLGVWIALDDFGVGYSSLSYLRAFPFQRIKIDGSFIRSVAQQDGSLAIIRAVTGLGAALGMETTAEGVETAAQLNCVHAEGYNEVQGYFFCPPMPAEQIASVLTKFDSQLSSDDKAFSPVSTQLKCQPMWRNYSGFHGSTSIGTPKRA